MSELPAGWTAATLGDLSEYITSGSRDWSKYYSDDGALFVRTQDINKNRLTSVDRIARVRLPEKVEGKRTAIEVGNILITITGANVGKCALVEEQLSEAYVSQSVALVRLVDGQLGRFVHRQLMAPSSGGGTLLQQSSYGLGRPVLNLDNVREVPLLIPPSKEQSRIVDKLDALLKRADACREKLDRVPLILKRFRQAVLAAATSGALTEDWRVGRTLLDQSIPTNTTDLPLIPEGWRWITFRDLTSSFRSGTTEVPVNEQTQIPVLRSSSVRTGHVNLEDVRYLTGRGGKADDFLEDSDLLFTRLSGSLEYVANCGVVRNLNGKRIQYPDRLFCARLNDKRNADYLEICFGSPVLRRFITVESKSTAGHQRVSMGAITRQPIPWPLEVEREEIVRRVHKLFSFADRLEARYLTACKQVDQLTPSLLAKAFRGELVEQDPNDEPASVLLERIKAERAKAATTRTPAPARSPRKAKLSKPDPLPEDSEPPKAVNANIPDRILAAMLPGREYTRAEITTVSEVTDIEWSWAIKQLKAEGKVWQTGERRAARYHRS